MTQSRSSIDPLDAVKRPLLLTQLGMAAERFLRAFWPLSTLVLAATGLTLLRVWAYLPAQSHLWIASAGGLFALFLFLHGVLRFRWPRRARAMAHLDAALPNHPLAALSDSQAIGAGDPASEAIWRIHQQRMQTRLALVRARAPDLRLSRQDPFALRYVGALILLVALVFGGGFGTSGQVTTGGAAQNGSVTGPAWEGWIEPPLYTGLPSLYLNDQIGNPLELPENSRVTIRLYGEAGELSVEQNVGDAAETTPKQTEYAFDVTGDGTLQITGDGGAEWNVKILPDSPPMVEIDGELDQTLAGEMHQPFAAADDYGVEYGQAVISLNMDAVDRRYGLAVDPEPVADIVLDLPTPFIGDRTEYTETLIGDLSEHPWAGLPVTLTMEVIDGATQAGQTDPLDITLPGRRFFNPAARAMVEMRRDLLWSRENAPRIAMILRTITHRPEEVFEQPSPYLMLRTVIRRMEAAIPDGLSDSDRTEFADALWTIALQMEEGDAYSALERMRQAQERLRQAMRDGASDSEIQELMDELRDATRDYMRQLAQNPESTVDQPDMGDTQMLSQQQIQEMMDRIQELMEQGRMAEAEELMRQFQQMMENLRMTDQQGDGEGSPSDQAMEGLSDTLRDQQDLSDESFRNLQDQFNGGQGQNGAPTQEELADRQRALRDELERQQGSLPGEGTEEGEAAERALRDAERAMDNAEQDLREGDLPGALEDQADAMEALREGLRQLAEGQRRTERDMQGQAGAQAEDDDSDPLGRSSGAAGSAATDNGMLQDEDVYRRARELLDELRERSSDPKRPKRELNYLERLLDRF